MSRSAFEAAFDAAQEGYGHFGPLADYDYRSNGPLLGISDGGDAAATIAGAAARSAKAQVAGTDAGERIGLILDAERMGSCGEVPVGPPEYDAVAAAAFGHTYFSTNVGVRTNARHYQPYPEVAVSAGADIETVANQAIGAFRGYAKDPAGKPRPVCVRLALAGGVTGEELKTLTERIEAARETNFAGPELHRLGVLRTLEGPVDTAQILGWIDAVADAGATSLALDGPTRAEARIRLGVQGLLNILPAAQAEAALGHAAQKGIKVEYRFAVDVQSVTRTIWAGLTAARGQGLNAAKYGLTPLTFEEQTQVVGQIQQWMTGWTAVPAFYADTPLVTADGIYLSDRVVEAARLWLEMVAKAGVRLVLFDCPDRYAPRIDVTNTGAARSLVRTGDTDTRGAFTLAEIAALHRFAQDLGVGILWSGGIQPGHAFELGRIGAAGFFTTGSTAIQVPVGTSLASDPRLLSQASPTDLGVRRVHALSQAGFQTLRLEEADPGFAAKLAEARVQLEKAAPESTELASVLNDLDALLVEGWRKIWSS